jgi:DNA repair protein RadA/Sms
MKKTSKSIFTCQACGHRTPKWMGKCPECGEWDTLLEEPRLEPAALGGTRRWNVPAAEPVPIDSIRIEDDQRLLTGIKEFDRALGGGLVAGSMVLVGGDPGIGKSTLMLQALHSLTADSHRSVYVSGEESIKQIRLRGQRLQTISPGILVVSEVAVDSIVNMIETVKPEVVVIDSIQTMFNADLSSAPGTVSQVREAAIRLMLLAKKTGIAVFLVGHVTKDGAIAGPKLLEHMVDTVLYFEGDQNHMFRILRTVKNRFGSTNEIGVFEMKDEGLMEVTNPSAVFLSERPDNAPGSVVTASMEGSRPILVELQALASSTGFGTPRRTILGIDPNRVALLAAVMEKKLGMHLVGHDIFINVAGGVKVVEPAVDLAIVAAIASSFLDKPVPEDTLVLGEVGLAGEVRGISRLDIRIAEARKMGFSRCILPQSNLKRMRPVDGIRICGVRNVTEGIEALF